MALETNVLVGSVKSGEMYGDFEYFTGTGQKSYQATIIRCGQNAPTLFCSNPFHSAPPSPPSPRRFNFTARQRRAHRGADL